MNLVGGLFLAVVAGCFLLSVIEFRRQHRKRGLVFLVVGLLILLAPLPTLSIKVELPPAAHSSSNP